MGKASEELTEAEESALHRICREDKCYRKCAPGYVVCLNCLHGTSPRADDAAVAAKKKLERINRKAAVAKGEGK